MGDIDGASRGYKLKDLSPFHYLNIQDDPYINNIFHLLNPYENNRNSQQQHETYLTIHLHMRALKQHQRYRGLLNVEK